MMCGYSEEATKVIGMKFMLHEALFPGLPFRVRFPLLTNRRHDAQSQQSKLSQQNHEEPPHRLYGTTRCSIVASVT
jgi:hypothetical protein